MNTGFHFFSKDEEKRISDAIIDAEKNCSGEIRVHIENYCPAEQLDKAAYIFKKLEMHKTELRNGVLIYLAIKDQKFAILGDVGINALVPENFWNDVKDIMQQYFKEHKFVDGLTYGIQMTGQLLQKHFPYAKSDKDELKNDISYGE